MADEDDSENATADPGEAEAEQSEHDCLVTWSRGQKVLHPSRDQLVDVVRALRDDGYLMCLDVTVVDYLTHRGVRDLPAGIAPERFEQVVVLISHADRTRIRLRVQVPEPDPVVPSLFELHPGTEALEREAFDMFGLRYDGHPDLTRILMPEDWDGHPLRKDHAIGRIPVQFKGAPSAR